jgi:DNA-binding transcriptional LysR family regulator
MLSRADALRNGSSYLSGGEVGRAVQEKNVSERDTSALRTLFLDDLLSRPLTPDKQARGLIEVIKQCAMSGMGVAVLPAIDVAREAHAGRIAVLSWAGSELHVVTQMVRHKDKWLSPALQAFLAMTRDVLVGSQTKN